jgi:hypothetical protein
MAAETRKPSRRRNPSLERLEGRAVPATFGVPWKDPGHLTLSFAPDGTAIAGHVSSLSATLDPQMPTATWQHQILQAFQTWAVKANINIGLVADGGQAFGGSGPGQHDPRFGDIRVGAQAMAPDALSISVPNDPSLSSTWTGDVMINSADSFGPGGLDLVRVMLHEAGHVFGIDDGTDPNSVMGSHYNPNSVLTSDDVAALQALYGVRSPDLYDAASSNDSANHATTLQFPGSYQGATPLVVYGDITTNRDVDYYAFRPMSGYEGTVTIRLQSKGISLLATKLSVVDSRGNVLASTQAASDAGNVVSLTLPSVDSNTTYFLKVQGATADVFGIGGYAVAATFDARNAVDAEALERVMRGSYQSLGPNEIAEIFTDPDRVLFHDDQHSDDGTESALELSATPGFASNSHYEAIGSLSDSADIDFYSVRASDSGKGQANVLTATVRAVDPNGAAPRIRLFDRDMHPVAARVLANGDGTYTVEAGGMKSGARYFVEVRAGSTGQGVGNYALDVGFGHVANTLETFAQDTLDATSPTSEYDLYVAESQLFQFLLSASTRGQAAGTTVTLTIRDASGHVLYTLATGANDTASGAALFLTPGAYRIEIAVSSEDGVPVPPVAVSLLGEAISDPIGPTLGDSTLTPIYTTPSTPPVYTYPDGTTTSASFLVVPNTTSGTA